MATRAPLERPRGHKMSPKSLSSPIERPCWDSLGPSGATRAPPRPPPERPRDGPWQVFLRFRGSVHLLCSSGSNNQRRMRREQSKTNHSGGEETEKQKGTARGRFSPERTHQNHRFPMGFFMFSPNSTLLCKSARGKKQHQTKPKSRPKSGRQAPLGSPPGLFGGPLALQNHGFC